MSLYRIENSDGRKAFVMTNNIDPEVCGAFSAWQQMQDLAWSFLQWSRQSKLRVVEEVLQGVNGEERYIGLQQVKFTDGLAWV